MRNTLFLLLVVMPFLSISQTRSFYFDKAQANLLDSSALSLDTFYKNCLSDHSSRILLQGYTDTLGSQLFNERLASKRIETVMAYLRSKEFPEKQISVEQMGEVVTAVGEEWQNRRVQIVIKGATDMYEQMLGKDHKLQLIEFRNNNDTVINGTEGTVLVIPKDAFVDTRGKPIENITLELKEYYKLEDIALSNLSTITTDGQLMETNGMFYMMAYDRDGNRAKLAPGKSIDAMVPDVRDAVNMKIYKGRKERNSIKWKAKSGRAPMKYGVVRTKYSYVQRRKSITSLRAIAMLDAYLQNTLKFPENAVTNNRCGAVKLEFYLDSDGNIVKPIIRGRGIPGSINRHVLKTIKNAPKLCPSHLREKRALSFKYSLVLKFVTEKCSRQFKRLNKETLSFNWMNLEPKSFWGMLRDSTATQESGAVLYRTFGGGNHNIDKLVNSVNGFRNKSFPSPQRTNSDFKLLMNQGRVVLRGQYSRGYWNFENTLPRGKAWLLGVQYKEGQAYISTTPIDLAKESPKPLPFRAVTVEELKREIRELSFPW